LTIFLPFLARYLTDSLPEFDRFLTGSGGGVFSGGDEIVGSYGFCGFKKFTGFYHV